MNIGGRRFPNSFGASGARGFFGEGYRHHLPMQLLFPGFDFDGSGFISKTITIPERMPRLEELGMGFGNMVLDRETLQPVEMFPDCISVSWLSGEAANSVGLSNPGAEILFEMGLWQEIRQPFIISSMAIGEDRIKRLQQTRAMRNLFVEHRASFSAPVAWQANKSCPNTGHDPAIFMQDTMGELEIANEAGIPVGIKINVLTPIDAMVKVANSGLCAFLEIPNTLPIGALPDKVDWRRKYGGKAPLPTVYGAGGYSGPENFQLALEWIYKARHRGIEIPIICGGVSCREDVRKAKVVGANAVAFARITMSPFHAWKVAGIIEEANKIFED